MEKYDEDFNEPDLIGIRIEEYQKLKDNIEYYEIAISKIKEKVDSVFKKNTVLVEIKELIEELENELNKCNI